ncbi:MAG: tellurite resistance protein TerC [Frankiales bacterium]|nr:tellurite resistance protein TerC [Frankiales bacterium]
MLDVTLTTWLATLGGLLAIMAFDQWVAHRKGEHEFSVGEATRWVVCYVGLAVAFGLGLWLFGGHQAGAEFFAGYLTEYSLSVDNLFVFVIIMSSFAVPRAFQHKVLLVGIALALLLRGIFIAVGAAAINQFVWVFFLFGAFLVFTAWKLARSGSEHDEPGESKLVALMSKVLPTTDTYDGERVLTKVDGRRVVTPMLLVMVAIGSTDLLFALDSIPAIFGLTKEPYIVFTANAFALMGLRQLYFLLDGLLDRLVYLSKGLAVILGFIGVKLVLHAAHEYGASVPDIGIAVSLGVIVVTLAVTTVLSLRATRR